jgi:hypothetical protein
MSENLLAERQRLTQHLGELELFLKSTVYRGWQVARATQLRRIEDDIVDIDPINRETEIEIFKLRGERRLLQDLENQFEDTRETLKSRLDEIEELLQPNPNQHEQ